MGKRDLSQQATPNVDLRVRAIAQSHEGQQWPLIVGGRVSAILDSDPSLYLGTSARMSTKLWMRWQSVVPGVVKVDDADDGREAVVERCHGTADTGIAVVEDGTRAIDRCGKRR